MKKKARKKLTIIMTVILIALITLLIVMGAMKKNGRPMPKNKAGSEKEITLDDNIVVTSIKPYDGAFVEDGTNEEVDNILAIEVKNNGLQTLQYAEAKLIFGDVTAEFAFSTLRPGESMVVLEKNRLKLPKGKKLGTSHMENVIYFTEDPGMCDDKFEISAMDEAFNIRNISGEDLEGYVAVYYKNRTEQGYLGGITYRVVIEGGIKKDEIKQIVATHYKVDKSQIVFVDYTEVE